MVRLVTLPYSLNTLLTPAPNGGVGQRGDERFGGFYPTLAAAQAAGDRHWPPAPGWMGRQEVRDVVTGERWQRTNGRRKWDHRLARATSGATAT